MVPQRFSQVTQHLTPSTYQFDCGTIDEGNCGRWQLRGQPIGFTRVGQSSWSIFNCGNYQAASRLIGNIFPINEPMDLPLRKLVNAVAEHVGCQPKLVRCDERVMGDFRSGSGAQATTLYAIGNTDFFVARQQVGKTLWKIIVGDGDHKRFIDYCINYYTYQSIRDELWTTKTAALQAFEIAYTEQRDVKRATTNSLHRQSRQRRSPSPVAQT